VTYHGRITAKVPAWPPALTGYLSGWTCKHAHRDHGAAFECAVRYAKSHALKTGRGQQSAAKNAGIRSLEITVVQA
jgi:hypothetical protein